MLLDRGAYLSPQSDSETVTLALERSWLDWKNQQLIEPKWLQLALIRLLIEYFQKFMHSSKEALERSSPILKILSSRFSSTKAVWTLFTKLYLRL